MENMLKIDERDNVAVILSGPLSGHKRALRHISKGERVIKYGYPIGIALTDIEEGEHVHTHNLKTALSGKLDYVYEKETVRLPETEPRYFEGYIRKDGRAGIRNDIWIIPTVGCVNDIAKAIAKEAGGQVIAFNHPYGCSQMGEDQDNFRKAIAALSHHPNAGGVLILSLGCEDSNPEVLKPYIGEYDAERVRFLVCQEVGDEIQAGVGIVKELAEIAAKDKREKISASKLVIGLKCGGSDGYSGITANPCVGAFSDLLISKGGTTLLTEVPEMFGAETILMNRARDEEVFEKTVKMINDFKDFFLSHGLPVSDNPSAGNIKGGITTLEEKSLGCTYKGGSAEVEDVLSYAEPVKRCGLNLVTAPGNDLVASTAEVLSGAHMILFTTGRGTPFASPVPTMKISTNTALYEKKQNWIDFDAGQVLSGMSLYDAGEALMEKVLRVASGEPVLSEKEGYRDIAILKTGVTC